MDGLYKTWRRFSPASVIWKCISGRLSFHSLSSRRGERNEDRERETWKGPHFELKILITLRFFPLPLSSLFLSSIFFSWWLITHTSLGSFSLFCSQIDQVSITPLFLLSSLIQWRSSEIQCEYRSLFSLKSDLFSFSHNSYSNAWKNRPEIGFPPFLQSPLSLSLSFFSFFSLSLPILSFSLLSQEKPTTTAITKIHPFKDSRRRVTHKRQDIRIFLSMKKEERDQNSWTRNNKILFLIVCSGYDPILDALGFERQRRLVLQNERMRDRENER